MRAVIQRVSRASVEVASEVVGAIDGGLLVLVGVTHSDTESQAVALAQKVAGLRIFPDDHGKMNRSVMEVGGEVLVISQFTLYGDARRGRRPSFVAAAPPDQAAPLVDAVVAELRRLGLAVETGRFGETMEVNLVNQGPVTIIVDVEG